MFAVSCLGTGRLVKKDLAFLPNFTFDVGSSTKLLSRKTTNMLLPNKMQFYFGRACHELKSIRSLTKYVLKSIICSFQKVRKAGNKVKNDDGAKMVVVFSITETN